VPGVRLVRSRPFRLARVRRAGGLASLYLRTGEAASAVQIVYSARQGRVISSMRGARDEAGPET
jgi:hypothetical protein